MRQVFVWKGIHVLLRLDAIALEDPNFPSARPYGNRNRRWRMLRPFQSLYSFQLPFFPVGRSLGLFYPVFPAFVFFGGRHVFPVVIVDDTGIVEGRLLVTVITGLSRVQHVSMRCESVNRAALGADCQRPR